MANRLIGILVLALFLAAPVGCSSSTTPTSAPQEKVIPATKAPRSPEHRGIGPTETSKFVLPK
jgi:hypothetical protein